MTTQQIKHGCNCKVGSPIAIFLRRRAGLSDKIGEAIIKNTHFQYERSLAVWSVVERHDIYCLDQEQFKLQIGAIKLAEMTWLYYTE
jgi:hypothetical protein